LKDAVISQCVLCLIPGKQKTLEEIVRVLKPCGRVVMHDVVTREPMPNALKEDPKLCCGCIGGAVSLEEYVGMMKKAGLTDIETTDFTKSVNRILNANILSHALG